MSDTNEINKWLNQTINKLEPTEKKEYILNTNYAGRKVYITIKIDALNNTSKESN
tara:strand:+ start:937 stop:1101 length:165 start_codon:yes stop_codon:yes gene_type:complete